MVEGIVLLVLGAAAIAIPAIAGIVATIWLGWVFITGGFVGPIVTLHARQAPGFGWSPLSVLLALAVSGVLGNPLRRAIAFIYVLITCFIIDGVIEGVPTIFPAIAHRRKLTAKWEPLRVNEIIDLRSL